MKEIKENENNFYLLDVNPRCIYFFYDPLNNIDEYYKKKKNNIIEKKKINIKNICSKTQNITIYETESKLLKIKGKKKTKLSPGNCENIIIEFSFYNYDIKENLNFQDILHKINNIECLLYLKIESNYCLLNIPIYIKKRIAIFEYNNIINLGICKNNCTYNFELKIKNKGKKKGRFTICLNDFIEENKKKKNNNKIIENENNINYSLNKKNENLLIEFDKTSIDINENEIKTINIKIKNTKEENIQYEYKVLVDEFSYFEEKPKNLILIAFFVNSRTYFTYDNIKTNEIYLNYIYFGPKQNFNGKIKNENNYPIQCKYEIKKINSFYSLENLKKYSMDNQINKEIKYEVFIKDKYELNEKEKKERELSWINFKKYIKVEEIINIKLNEEKYIVNKLNYCDVFFEITFNCDIYYLQKIKRTYSYLLNFPIIIEIILYINKYEENDIKKLEKNIEKKLENIEKNNEYNEEIHLFVSFCLTFPCLLSNNYFLNFNDVVINESKTLIIEIMNKNKFLKVNYSISKIPSITLNKKEGYINPLEKDIITFSFKSDIIKTISEYIYIFFCNNLYFFVLYINVNVKKSRDLLPISMNLNLNNKQNVEQINIKMDKKNKTDDIIFNKILNFLTSEKINRKAYDMKGLICKYKYNEEFVKHIQKNKKKYNDILKTMYEERKKKEKLNELIKKEKNEFIKEEKNELIKKEKKVVTSLIVKEKKTKIENKNKMNVLKKINDDITEENKIKNIANKVINDVNLYMNNFLISKITSTFISQDKYTNLRKEYKNIEEIKNKKIIEINKEINEDTDDCLYVDNILTKEELNNIIYPKFIDFDIIFLNYKYTKSFIIQNKNKCNIKIDFNCNNELSIEKKNVFLKKNSEQKINIQLCLKDIYLLKKETYEEPIEIVSNEIQNELIETKNTLFFEKSYQNELCFTINNNNIIKTLVYANILLFNIFVKTNTLYFYNKQINENMFYENKLILYNPFNISINIKLKYNPNFFNLLNNITLLPYEHKILSIKYISNEKNNFEDYIYLYLNNNRLYKKLICKYFNKKIEYKINPNELHFNEVILNKNYTKYFYITNTSNFIIVFRCIYKPDFVSIISKYNYININEKIKIIVKINLKENIKVQDKIIFEIKGSDNIIIPISAKCSESLIIFYDNINIYQEKGELKNYELNILNKGLCDEKLYINLNCFNFLNIKINDNKKNYITYNNKEYKISEDNRNVLKKLYLKTENENVLINYKVKYFYENFLKLYNYIYNKNNINLYLSEENEKNNNLNLYEINIASKCYVSLFIQCYNDEIIKKELYFNNILTNKILYEEYNKKININIKNDYIDIYPIILYFPDMLTKDSNKSFITYFEKEKKKIIKIKNIYHKNIKYNLRIYNEKEKERYFLIKKNIEKKYKDGKKIKTEKQNKYEKIKKNEEKEKDKKKVETNEKDEKKNYEIIFNKQEDILKTNEEKEISITVKDINQNGNYCDILCFSINIDKENNENNIDNVNENNKINYIIFILLQCIEPCLYFDITYINIIHNKLNDYIVFSFNIYNKGYQYIRINSYFENSHKNNFFISIDYPDGCEINNEINTIRVFFKCKANKNLNFKSNLLISVLELDTYNIPVFININERIDYFLDLMIENNKYLNMFMNVNKNDIYDTCYENDLNDIEEIENKSNDENSNFYYNIEKKKKRYIKLF